MADSAVTTSEDQLRRALDAIRRLKAKVAQAEARTQEPIAIVGLGTRFPGGVTTPTELWTLLQQGVDATSEVPPLRWNRESFFDPDAESAGKISTKRGGFIDDVTRFDPQHFGIAPAEATHLDPQHRLLLETVWESLEHAAIAPDGLVGEAVGVFIGISSSDYAQRLCERGLDRIDPYVGSGNAHSVAAGRIAYCLGLQGPAVAVDTACSSSLVAVHWACQSLRAGECNLALTGGVNLQLNPIISVNHSRARMLSPDGRCKAFGDQADGFGRSDGCGIVVLKRLSDAQQDGDRVLAVIRGSATNQDGRTSGLTVPNGQAQQAVINAALNQAGASPAEIDYLEAHGTGTALGDPIEAHALGAVFAERPAENPLWLGSIKSNLGHCEAAAGIAGLIKVVLALHHEKLPVHLHATPPSSRIDWANLSLRIVNEAQPWPRQASQSRLAGVSSFGFGGTNAHVVLAEAPLPTSIESETNEPPELLPLSARTPAALQQIAAQLRSHLQQSRESWNDVSFTHAVGRAGFPYRALVADQAALGDVAENADSAMLTDTRPKVAFMFSGQGSLQPGVGWQLRETVPAFREAFDAAGNIVRAQAGWEVSDVLDDADRLAKTEYLQVALFCISYGLARTWQTWGVEPEVVLGHSVGEYAAACVAGVLTLEDALNLLIKRAQAMGALGDQGAMVAISAAPEKWEAKVRAAGAEIGAYNAPRQFVITGNRDRVTSCAELLSDAGLPTFPLKVRQGYHSQDMEPMVDGFRRHAADVSFQLPHCEFISSVSGKLEDKSLCHADYWADQIRRPVRWRAAVETLSEQQIDIVLDLGPGGMLTNLSQHTWSTASSKWQVSLPGKGHPSEAHALRSVAAALWQQGAVIRWPAVHAGRQLRRLDLPTYPFERVHYWPEESATPAPAYRLVEHDVASPSEAVTTSQIWHLIGDLPSWKHELIARDQRVIDHPTGATPLALQPHLNESPQPLRVLISRDHPAASTWVGAAKVLALEYPDYWHGLSTVTADLKASDSIAAIIGPAAAPVVHWDESGGKTASLKPDPLPPATWQAWADVTYVITGGLGALGLRFANWLSDRGATSLLLLGRREPTSVAETQLASLRSRGIEVATAQVDVTDRDALEAALSSSPRPLGGVIHAAGIGGYELFSNITAASWSQITAAKVTGARLLDELTSEDDLGLFVLFSSIASVWGSQGQAHYAAANQALDDLAVQRRARGLCAMAVNWGPWAEGGVATAEAARQLSEVGIDLLDPEPALVAFESALVAGRSQTVIANVRWERFREVYELRGPTELLCKLPAGQKPAPTASTPQTPAILAERLENTSPDDQLSLTLQHVRSAVAEVLKFPADQMTPSQKGFADLGIDSLMAINLRRRLSADLGVELASTLIFDHPDCERLAEHLLAQWTASHQPVADSATTDDDAAAALERKLSQLGF